MKSFREICEKNSGIDWPCHGVGMTYDNYMDLLANTLSEFADQFLTKDEDDNPETEYTLP